MELGKEEGPILVDYAADRHRRVSHNECFVLKSLLNASKSPLWRPAGYQSMEMDYLDELN